MSSFCCFMLRRTLKRARCHGDTMLNSRRYRTLPFPVLYTDCSFKHTTGLYYSFITPRNEHELGVQVLRGDSVDVDVSEKSGHAQMWASWRGEARRGKTRLSPHRNYTETGLSPKSSSGHEAKRNFQSVIQRTHTASWSPVLFLDIVSLLPVCLPCRIFSYFTGHWKGPCTSVVFTN